MKKTEADRLRDIADTLDDQYYNTAIDSTNSQSQWFHWGATEIRKLIMDGGHIVFTNKKYDNTQTTCKFNEEE